MHDDDGMNPLEQKLQIEILGKRMTDSLRAAKLADQSEARDAKRYGLRIAFALDRVRELRGSATRNGSAFEAGRLDVALNILEGHVRYAAIFIDRVAQRQRGELASVNRRIAGETATEQILASDPEATDIREAA